MEMIFLREHLKGHDVRFGHGEWNKHHQLHHYLVSVNFAFDPADDKAFGTLADDSVAASAYEKVENSLDKQKKYNLAKIIRLILGT